MRFGRHLVIFGQSDVAAAAIPTMHSFALRPSIDALFLRDFQLEGGQDSVLVSSIRRADKSLKVLTSLPTVAGKCDLGGF